jgi:hypothetical protein
MSVVGDAFDCANSSLVVLQAASLQNFLLPFKAFRDDTKLQAGSLQYI